MLDIIEEDFLLRSVFLNAQQPFQGVKISRFWDTLDDTLEKSWPILLDTLG